MQIQTRFYYFLIYCSIIFVIFNCNVNSSKSPPKAVNGILDLRDWDFNKNGALSITGEWEFYWSKFINPDDFQQFKSKSFTTGTDPQNPQLIQVPGIWNGFKIKNEDNISKDPLGAFGYATYRLRILCNEKSPLSISLLSYSNPIKLYANGKLLASIGTIGNNSVDSIPAIGNKLITLQPENTELDLVIQASNFHYYRGGLWKPIKFGKEEDVRKSRERILFSDIFICGSLFIMGLYHFGLFILRKKDTSTFYFGLYCILIGMNSLTNGELYFFQIFNELPFELGVKLDYLTFYLTPSFFILFLSKVLKKDINPLVVNIIVVLSSILYSIVILFPASIGSYTTQYMQMLILFTCIYTIYIFFQCVRKKRDAAKIFLFGSFIFSAIIVNDILEDNQIIRTGHYTPLGLLVFIFSQSFILSMRSARAFSNSEKFAEDLEKNNIELTDLKNSLEVKVTERTKELEAEKKIAEDARSKLAEADREKTSFFQNISHELRTPLTLIASPVESFLRRSEPLDLKTMEMVSRNTKRLKRLVNQLLDLQKITAGKMELNLTSFDMTIFLQKIYKSFEPYAESRNIVLEISLDENLPLVNADIDKLDKCVYNYLSNALKFTPENGKIKIYAYSDNNKVYIEVSDSGIGILKEKIAGLFTKFGHSETSLTREQEGTGLGLSLVKELVEMHGGEVGVDSEIGVGSKFWFSIPFNSSEKISETIFPENNYLTESVELGGINFIKEDITQKVRNKNRSFKGKSILIVEDNSDLRNYMSDIFSEEGYNVITAENGEEGLIIARAENPQIILTDLMMPKLSGSDMIKKIRKIESLKLIPIVLLTAKADEDTRIDIKEAGADSYLSKPFNDRELLSSVRNLLNLKEREMVLVKDIKKARNIQQNLLPESLPIHSHVKFSALYEPMDLVGGDLYDFIEFPDGSIGIFIADVSGHGMPAAMIASIVKVILSILSEKKIPPSELLEILNYHLYGKTAENFLTAWYGILDPEAKKIQYATAGHPTPILIRDEKIHFLQGKGSAIAISPNIKYNLMEKDLQKNDRLLFYTDGITEVFNPQGELFEDVRLSETFLKNSKEQIGLQLNFTISEVREFQGKNLFDDDITLIGMVVE